MWSGRGCQYQVRGGICVLAGIDDDLVPRSDDVLAKGFERGARALGTRAVVGDDVVCWTLEGTGGVRRSTLR